MQAFEHAVTLIPKLTGPDYFIKARKYRSYDQLEGEKLNKIILIQRNFRRYLLEKRIRNAAAEWRYANGLSYQGSIIFKIHNLLHLH